MVFIKYSCDVFNDSFRNNEKDTASEDRSWHSFDSLMTTHGDEVPTVLSRGVVAYPDVRSSREARTIGRLKLALVVVSLGLLVVTVLFVWQITKKNNASNQVSYKGGICGVF